MCDILAFCNMDEFDPCSLLTKYIVPSFTALQAITEFLSNPLDDRVLEFYVTFCNKLFIEKHMQSRKQREYKQIVLVPKAPAAPK